MAKKKVNLDEVMNELKIIKKLVLKNLQLDEQEIKLDKKIMATYKGKEKHKTIFDDRFGWEANIWDECLHKKVISTDNDFEYHCKLLKKMCGHNICPLNIKKK